MNNKESQYANFKYFKSWKETVRVLRKLNANFKENDKNIVVSFIQKKDMQIYPRQGDCIRVEMKLCLEAAYIHVPDKYYRIRIDLDDVEKRINPTPFVDLENIEGFLTGIYNYINHIKNEESEIEIERSSSVVGSPEWFYEKSQTDMIRKFQEWIEKKRERFIARFSPECLSEMSGKELLENVFSSSDDSLARILMNDESFRNFGAAGKYSYLGIVFYNRSKGAWNYRVGSEDVFLNEDEAREKAELVRDDLLYCIGSIEEIGSFETIDDYVILQNRISKVPFYD
nr:hypothetical protein [Eubacterium sp.]